MDCFSVSNIQALARIFTLCPLQVQLKRLATSTQMDMSQHRRRQKTWFSLCCCFEQERHMCPQNQKHTHTFRCPVGSMGKKEPPSFFWGCWSFKGKSQPFSPKTTVLKRRAQSTGCNWAPHTPRKTNPRAQVPDVASRTSLALPSSAAFAGLKPTEVAKRGNPESRKHQKSRGNQPQPKPFPVDGCAIQTSHHRNETLVETTTLVGICRGVINSRVSQVVRNGFRPSRQARIC